MINRAIDSNEKNEIPKDENDFYIPNDTNSIKIELILIGEEQQKQTYQMEQLQKAGITGFVRNFNLISFKCVETQYHEKTKLISKIVLEQLEE